MSLLDPATLLIAALLATGAFACGWTWARRGSPASRVTQTRAARDVDMLLSNLAHELRTPLTSLLGYAEIAQEPSLETECRAECIDRTLRSARLLLRVVNDLFDYTRLQQGRLTIHPVDCEPRALLRRIDEAARADIERKGLIFVVTADDNVPTRLTVDPDRVAQIARALLDNAERFTRRGHVALTLSADTAARQLRIEVRDTGAGLSPELRHHLFRGLRQGDGSPSRRHDGIGLGLALTGRLTAALHGHLDAQSTAGGGTRILVRLPYQTAAGQRDPTFTPTSDARAHDRPADATPPPRPALDGDVLLVEDGRDNQLLIRTVLRQLGLQVDIAENGLVALRAVERKRYDLVLMDMQMPVLDGYEATRQLRQRGETLPIIALTAHALSGDREKCLGAGCDAFLTKPLDRPALAETLAQYVTPATAEAVAARAR